MTRTEEKRLRQPETTARDTQEGQDTDIIFFYMPNATHGEFCQWFPSTFAVSTVKIRELLGDSMPEPDSEATAEDFMQFGCAEQFMMFCKAGRFGDARTQARVMATDSPKEQKRLGKTVNGFTDLSWDEVESTIVEEGNMAKFGQNPRLGRKLLATGTALLCEAASRDRIWGIGYSEKHAMSHQKHWGENRLGKALMAVRTRLREEAPVWAKAVEAWENSAI